MVYQPEHRQRPSAPGSSHTLPMPRNGETEHGLLRFTHVVGEGGVSSASPWASLIHGGTWNGSGDG